MDGKDRRDLLVEILGSGEPITGTSLAHQLKVSRQVIVGDIAILRASGVDIYATPQGYLLPGIKNQMGLTAKIACRHGRDKLADELTIIIDNGGKVLDVVVEHPIYGDIKGNLMLSSRRDIAEFMRKLEAGGVAPLSLVTDGVHLHTIEVPSAKVLKTIETELKEQGILLG
jgi:transcriptional regulator of NAD metabolism